MNRKTSKSYNSSKKVLTLFVVFILLFTAFSTVVSSRKTLSEKLSDFKEKVENIKTKERPILDSIKSSQLKENIKEKVQNILNLIKKPSENNKNRFIKSSPTNNFLNSLANYISLKESSSLLSFYTNYAGNEKTTDLRLGM